MMEQDKREENKRMMFQAFLIKYGEIGITQLLGVFTNNRYICNKRCSKIVQIWMKTNLCWIIFDRVT